ncbi:3-dehydrosphinganine reductase TSC10B [Carex littledalei]|uniref:3-dehydrosphinganine reductase TSC10B n=1 Tax=Carex littledalei TaxID=544730 RepID=A0A833VXB7_9POAL|nr:3-dehydrosphinganine reductase TSC10B [Carex littledalei]
MNSTTSQKMRSVSSYTSAKGIAAIVGVGPKLGRSVLINKLVYMFVDKLSELADEIACEAKAQVFAIRIDCSDCKSVREAFEGVLSLGPVEVLVYNACEPASYQPSNFMSIKPGSFQQSLAASALGSFYCAQQVIPGMVERGRGTIIFTGSSASLNGFAGYSELSCSKFAMRGLSQCLAKEFFAFGIHVAHVVIDGAISTPRSSKEEDSTNSTCCMDPDAIAQSYWHIHTQDKRAWTQELDLRSPYQRF